MVTLVRTGSGPDDCSCATGLADLTTVANGEGMAPRECINQAGDHITRAMKDYVIPFTPGEI